MPTRMEITRDKVSLPEAVNWIAYDRLEGPTVDHLERFRLEAEAGVVGPASWMRKSREAIQHDFEQSARTDLLVILRDGDLRAEGRLSETQTKPWTALSGPWGLHSGKFTMIPVEFWVGGQINWKDGRMTYHEGEYMDVRLSLFFLQAIWPPSPKEKTAPVADMPPGGPLAFAPTPYLELLNKAVEKFWSSGAPPTEKKDVLVQWLMEQTVGGELLSRNLAESMATMIRPLEARTGGNRKWR